MQADRLMTSRPRAEQDGSSMIKFVPTHLVEPIRTHPAILANIQLERRPSESEPEPEQGPDSISKELELGLHNDLGVGSALQDGDDHLRLAALSRALFTPLEGRAARWSLAGLHNPIHLELQDGEELQLDPADARSAVRPLATLDGAAQRLPGDECERDNEPSRAKQLDRLKRDFEHFLESQIPLEQDRLELAVYLNEYETHSCDLSELLTNILRNFFVPDKIKSCAIKCKLLHYIKRLYIEPRFEGALTSSRAADGLSKLLGDQQSVGSARRALSRRPEQRSLESPLMSAGGKSELDLKLFSAMIRRYQLANQVARADESMLFGAGSMSDLATARDLDELAANQGARRAALRNLELERLIPPSNAMRSAQNQFGPAAQSRSHASNGFQRPPPEIPLNGTFDGAQLDQNIALQREATAGALEAFNFEQNQQQHIDKPEELRGCQSIEFATSCDDAERVSARQPLQSDIMRTRAYSASLDSLQEQFLSQRLDEPARAHLLEPEVMSPAGHVDQFEYPIQASSHNSNELLARLSTPPDFQDTSRFRNHNRPPLDHEHEPRFAPNRGPTEGRLTGRHSCKCAECLVTAAAGQLPMGADFNPPTRLAGWAGAPTRHISSSTAQRCHSSMSIPFEPGGGARPNQFDWPAVPPSSDRLLNYHGRLDSLASNYQSNGQHASGPTWALNSEQAHANAWIPCAYNGAGQPAPATYASNGAACSLPGSPSLMKQRGEWRHFSAFEGPHAAPRAAEVQQMGDRLHGPPENYQQQEMHPTLAPAFKTTQSRHHNRSSELGGQPHSSARPERHRSHELNQARRERRPQSARSRQVQGYGNFVDEPRSDSIGLGARERRAGPNEQFASDEDAEDEDADYDAQLLLDGPAESLALVPSQAKGRLPMSVAEQMSEQASKFVQHYGSASGVHRASLSAGPTTNQATTKTGPSQSRQGASRTNSSSAGNQLQVRRTLRVKIRKSKPILGIAIEGGFNVSGQLLPRIVCVHEEGAAYQCGKLRASDLILEVNGIATANMTHDQIAETIANAYYQDERPYIEFLIGESVHI